MRDTRGIKIDILKREVMTPFPTYHEYVRPPISAKILKKGEMPVPTSMTIHEEVYDQMWVWNPETKERVRYFVKTDDQKIFRDLLQVSDGFIAEKIKEAQEEILGEMLGKIEGIRRLPWWKRLFVQF